MSRLFKRHRVNRLKNLTIERCDLVDKGANTGARVLITKRDKSGSRVAFTYNYPFQKARNMSNHDSVLYDYLQKIQRALPRGHRAARYLGKALEALGDPRYGMLQAGGDPPDMSARSSSDSDDRSARQREDGQPASPGLLDPPDFDESSDSSSSVTKLFRARAWRVVEKRAAAYINEHPGVTRAKAIDHVMKSDSIARDAIGVYCDAPPDSDVFRGEPVEPIRESVAKREAWSAIEHEAARLMSKSASPISKAKAICEVMKRRTDLVRSYQEAR